MYYNFLNITKGPGIFLLMWFATLSASGQNPTLDSLKAILPNTQGSDKCEVLYQIGRGYVSVDRNLSLTYIDQGLQLSRALGDSAKIVKGSRLRGQILRRLDRVKESVIEFESVFQTARKHYQEPAYYEEYKFLVNGLAISNTYLANYDKALAYNFVSLSLLEKEKDSKEVSLVLNNIGLVYFKLKNYEQSLAFYQKALDLKNMIGDPYDMDKLMINIGLVYNMLREYEEAEESILNGLKNCEGNCSIDIRVQAEQGLGLAYRGMGNLDQAYQHISLSRDLAIEMENKLFIVDNLVLLASIRVQQDDISMGIALLKEAEKIADESGYNESLIDIYSELSKVYRMLNDFQNQANYANKYITLKDSIYSVQLIENLAQIQTDYAEKENIKVIQTSQIRIEQQQRFNVAIVIISFLAVTLILVLMRSTRITQKVNAQLSEAKQIIQEKNEQLAKANKVLDNEVVLKTRDLEKANQNLKQVNEELDNFIYKTSHDIRGPLASLKGMCNVALMDVKDPLALEYLGKLDSTAEKLNSILTRLLIINQINNSKLNNHRIDFHNLIGEILILEKKKGIPEKIEIRKEINTNAILTSDTSLVRIVLENLIDNAIKFYNDSERVQSFVDIRVEPNETGVRVRVIDNGIGISESSPGKLFQMFVRASERSEIGGIGLYIVKTATTKLGGQVGLRTTPEGYTEFYVQFPLVLPPQD